MNKFLHAIFFILFLWLLSFGIATFFFGSSTDISIGDKIAVIPIKGMITLEGGSSLPRGTGMYGNYQQGGTVESGPDGVDWRRRHKRRKHNPNYKPRSIGGLKVTNFAQALRKDENAVVLDLWMAREFGLWKMATPNNVKPTRPNPSNPSETIKGTAVWIYDKKAKIGYRSS